MGQSYHHLPCAQGMPGSVYVCIEVLLRGFASADSIAGVVVGKDVAVDASAKSDVEAAHLAEVDCIAMREKHCEPERRDVVKIWSSGYS